MSDLLVCGLGGVCTGDLERPLLEADSVVVRDGRVAAIGTGLERPPGAPRLDARGGLLTPGLIDSHVHVVFGDWTPRQNAIGFLESYVHGGITRAISASEVHLPGRPTDREGVKALAVAAQRAFSAIRPGGMTVHGGAVILEPTLEPGDLAELAAAGVWLAKAGMGAFSPSRDATPFVRAAQESGMVVMCHTGGESIPSSSAVTAADLLEMRPDVAGHVNGGTTALPDADLRDVVASGMALQICQAGNLRSALAVVDLARELGAEDRLLVASDTPTGTGVMPLAVIKSVVELASLSGEAPERVLCWATGNVRRAYRLDAGVVAEGAPADLLVLDAPRSSAGADALDAMRLGDLPGIGAVVTDGVVRVVRSRNTPPPREIPVLTADPDLVQEPAHV